MRTSKPTLEADTMATMMYLVAMVRTAFDPVRREGVGGDVLSFTPALYDALGGLAQNAETLFMRDANDRMKTAYINDLTYCRAHMPISRALAEEDNSAGS